MKLRVLGNNNIYRNKTYIIMYRQPAPNHAANNNSNDDFNNGNTMGHVRTSSVSVPSVIGPLDVSADMNSNTSISSSDTEESGNFVQDVAGNIDAMDPLTVEAIKAIKSGKTRQRIRLQDLPPEEAQRRSVRRERNKMAAAKCRQRRVNQTNELLDKTGDLEQQKGEFEQQIANLQQEKEQLEFILLNHKQVCKLKSTVASGNNGRPNKAVGVSRQTNAQNITVKSEPQSPGPSRPSSLPITSLSTNFSLTTPSTSSAEAATGIPITTPSGDGLFNFTVDNPGVTLLTPTCSTSGQKTKVASLNTPSINTPSSPTFMSL